MSKLRSLPIFQAKHDGFLLGRRQRLGSRLGRRARLGRRLGKEGCSERGRVCHVVESLGCQTSVFCLNVMVLGLCCVCLFEKRNCLTWAFHEIFILINYHSIGSPQSSSSLRCRDSFPIQQRSKCLTCRVNDIQPFGMHCVAFRGILLCDELLTAFYALGWRCEGVSVVGGFVERLPRPREHLMSGFLVA